MSFDLQCEHAHYVVMQAHSAFHFADRGRRRLGLQKDIVTLAVLLDLVGKLSETPILGSDDFAAVFRQDFPALFGQGVDLRVRYVLTRDENMLV